MSEKKEDKKMLALVRLRGSVHLRSTLGDTLKLLNLARINHCIISQDTPNVRGMVNKVNDYITWGEIEETTLTKLLEKRGRVAGNRPVDEEYIKKNSKQKDIKSFAKTLIEGNAKLKDVAGLKPVFRLNPPKGGHKRGGIKKPYTRGGALGYRGEKINELINSMI